MYRLLYPLNNKSKMINHETIYYVIDAPARWEKS